MQEGQNIVEELKKARSQAVRQRSKYENRVYQLTIKIYAAEGKAEKAANLEKVVGKRLRKPKDGEKKLKKDKKVLPKSSPSEGARSAPSEGPKKNKKKKSSPQSAASEELSFICAGNVVAGSPCVSSAPQEQAKTKTKWQGKSYETCKECKKAIDKARKNK